MSRIPSPVQLDAKERKIRFVAVSLPPFYIPKMSGSTFTIDGIGSHVYKFMTVNLNHSYELVESGEKGYGQKLNAGNWTGPIGMLIRKEVDIMAALYVLPSSEDFQSLEVSTAFDSTSFSILSSPAASSRSSQEVTSMFTSIGIDLWTCLGLSWFMVSLFYSLFSRFERRFMNPDTREETFISSLLTFYGLLFQRGFDKLPRIQSRRILVTGWLFMVLVLMIDIGGSLSSRLAVTDVLERLDRIEDIIKYPHLKPCLPRGVFVDSYFERSESTEERALWQQVLRMDGVMDSGQFHTPAMMDAISEGSSVAVANKEGYLATMVSLDCPRLLRPFHLGKESFHSLPIVVYLRRGLDQHFMETFNRRILGYGGMGFSQDIWKVSGVQAEPCLKLVQDRTSGLRPLSVRDAGQVFKLLGIGLVISPVVLLIEVLTHTLKNRRNVFRN